MEKIIMKLPHVYDWYLNDIDISKSVSNQFVMFYGSMS